MGSGEVSLPLNHEHRIDGSPTLGSAGRSQGHLPSRGWPLPHRSLGVVAVLLALAAPGPAGAAGGIVQLSWTHCSGSAGATETLASTCDSNFGGQDLIAAFVPDEAVDSVLAVEIVIDVRFEDATVPPWWQLGVGGCRMGAWTPTSVPPAGDACVDWWNRDLASGFLYQTGEAWQSPGQARIAVAFAIPGDTPARHLDAGTQYFAARLRLENLGTTTCLGCEKDACLVLNSIRLLRVPGQPGEDPVLETPAPGGGNWATWQGLAASCASVPARGSTWGRLKGLYR